MAQPPHLSDLIARHFRWAAWEKVIRQNGITIDRPYRSRHPRFPEIIYPLDYGYVHGTRGTDGEEVDVFVGRGTGGLTALLATTDHRHSDREFKLLWNCTPEEVYLAHGFINFDRALMEGLLVLRRPMQELWA